MIRHQFFIAAALLAGVAVGYFLKSDPAAPAAVEPEAPVAAKAAVADTGDKASVRALRARVAELERLLAAKDAEASNAVAVAVKETARPGERPRGNPREWLENLRKSDPARYAQMTNRFARWRQRRKDESRSTLDFLSSVDTSHMSAAAKKTHQALQDLIARREEIENELHQEGLSDEQREALMKEMHETHREMGRLNGEERQNLLSETARALGFSGDEAAEVTATIQDVIDATGGSGPRGFGPPPGGPGGAGGPGGGAPGGR